jgi:hypothetical protein
MPPEPKWVAWLARLWLEIFVNAPDWNMPLEPKWVVSNHSFEVFAEATQNSIESFDWPGHDSKLLCHAPRTQGDLPGHHTKVLFILHIGMYWWWLAKSPLETFLALSALHWSVMLPKPRSTDQVMSWNFCECSMPGSQNLASKYSAWLWLARSCIWKFVNTMFWNTLPPECKWVMRQAGRSQLDTLWSGASHPRTQSLQVATVSY